MALGRHGLAAAAAAVSPWQQAALGGDGPAVRVAQCLGPRHSELRAGVRLLVQEPLHLLFQRIVQSFTSLFELLSGKHTTDNESHLFEALVVVTHQLIQLRLQTPCLLFHSLS